MKVLKKVKYNGKTHNVGSKIQVKEKDKAELIRRGIIAEEVQPVYKEPVIEEDTNSNLTVAEIKVILDNKGIEYTNDMRKDELLELLEGA